MTAPKPADHSDHSFLVRLNETARSFRIYVLVAELLLYYPGFLVLHSFVGTSAVVLALVPAITFGGIFGRVAGLVVGFGLILPNFLILEVLGSMGPRTVDLVGLFVGHIALGGIGYIYGELFRLREKLAARLDDLQASEAKMRGLFESTRDAVVIIGLDQTIKDLNDQSLLMLGYKREELVNQPYAKIVVPEEHSDVKARVSQAMDGEKLPLFERTYIRKDGQRIFVEVNAAVIYKPDGRLSHFQSVSRDITARKAAEQELYFLATHDRLTGLYNKSMSTELLDRQIERAKRNKNMLAVCFLDLDGFKSVNDTYGHHIGDLVLKECARRLVTILRQSDIVARVGGDEFVVVLEPITEKEYAIQTAKRIEAAIGAPCNIEGKTVDIRVSVGIGFFPEDGENAKALLSASDERMYSVKHANRLVGRN